MSEPTQVEQIAAFAARASFDDLTPEALERFKLHILDTLGCAIAALNAEPTRAVRRVAEREAPTRDGPCTLIGGGRSTITPAALINGSLVRYMDFMDNFLAPSQTGHPCDTFASVLAAAESKDLSGRDFLACLAIAYQVFCRMMWEAPVQEHGFDHTVQLAYGVAAGTSKALGLSREQAVNALAIVGASAQGLVITRSEYLSQWKGLQSADVAMSALMGVLLAEQGITGPVEVLDGKEGFAKAFGKKLEMDWQRENLDVILRCSLKSYNSEVHTQPVVEAVLALREQHGLHERLDDVERVEVEVFKQAYDITGAGEEAGNKYDVRTKEQADHSLPYLVAVGLLDGEVTPRQFSADRIARSDVQQLLHKVRTLRDDEFTKQYPDATPVRVVAEMKDGRSFVCEKNDWLGFFKRRMPPDRVRAKFDALAEAHTDAALRDRIADAVLHLEHSRVRDLTTLLAQVK
jgi:2-methylcitrate dehydratase